MVKFGHYLASNRVPEWGEKYVRYKVLKKGIKRISAAVQAERAAREAEALFSLTLEKGEAAAAAATASPAAAPGVELAAPESPRKRKVEPVDPNNPASEEADRRLRLLRLNSDVADATATMTTPRGVRRVRFEKTLPAGVAGHAEEAEFFAELSDDFERVNTFFREQEEFFLGVTNRLVEQANRMAQAKAGKKQRQQRAALKRAARELYRGLELMKNYRILNYTAFVKILKKHDKHSDYSNASAVLMPVISEGHFYVSPMTETLRSKTEELFIEEFAHGNRSKGMERLRNRERAAHGSTLFRLGVYVGFIASLIIVLLFMSRIVPSINENTYFVAPFPAYRALALANLHLWMWGLDLVLYRRYRVNHLFIFEANTRNAARASQVLEVAAGMTVFLLGALNLYLLAWAQGPSETEPAVDNVGYLNVAVFCLSVAALLWPLKQLLRPTRHFFFRAVGSILAAPFAVVDFKGFFVADQLTSQVRLLIDLSYSVCFFATGSFKDNSTATCDDVTFKAQFVLPFLPYWWRLAQCLRRYSDTRDAFPHLANAGKYLSAILVTFFSLMLRWQGDQYEPVWIAFAVWATAYAYAWDIKKDWGLLEEGCANGGLRRKMVVPHRWVYYLAAVLNFLLRLSWILTISPQSVGLDFNSELFLLLVGALEVVRRGQWNFFRVENEHLNNCGKFRAVNVVPVMIEDEDEDAAYADEDEDDRGSGAAQEADARPPHFDTDALALAADTVSGASLKARSKSRESTEEEAEDSGVVVVVDEDGDDESDGGDGPEEDDGDEEDSDYEAYRENEVVRAVPSPRRPHERGGGGGGGDDLPAGHPALRRRLSTVKRDRAAAGPSGT